MTAPTLATFRALLDEHGFACSWSPMTEVRAKALHAALFPPALPHAQHIELGSLETSEAEATSGALWLPLATPEIHVHDVAVGLVQRAEFIRDLIADALQHDVDHGLGVEAASPITFRRLP
jgi:hypothetical protein